MNHPPPRLERNAPPNPVTGYSLWVKSPGACSGALYSAGRLLAVILGALFLLAGMAHAEVAREYQIKAAFLYNFTKFVEWPPARFADASSPIVIGVLGQNPFGDELAKIVKARTVGGRPILVKIISTADEVLLVHLLFVPAGEETHLPAVAWQNAAVVVVGESEGFEALGGIIIFTLEADKVRFAINLASADRAGLKLSAQLLKLATVVHRNP